jgi:Na+/H+ antiporter NhaD/arsenite permease-like protein
MVLWLSFVFIIGYFLIATEHQWKIDKAATALAMGTLSWIGIAYLCTDFDESLNRSFLEVAEILFFLLGAMTIVGIIDAHDGFSLVTQRIRTKKAHFLLIIIAFITFFLSAVLDNLTTTIVMITVIRKLVHQDKIRLQFVGIIVIAANAGGAWSPIGDVTTTMLWIGGQLPEVVPFIQSLFIPALISLLIPLAWFAFQLRNTPLTTLNETKGIESVESTKEQKFILIIGILGLLLVPVIKEIFHLPPYLGMMFCLGMIWIATELIHRKKADDFKKNHRAQHVLTTIDTPSILFFLGILMAVSGLGFSGILNHIANQLTIWMHGSSIAITSSIGILSAIIDNVPLVAAAQGMYPIGQLDYAPNGLFWELLAFTSGTGGSLLIIGSAAGVAAMGMEKVSFGWYLKKISLPAFIGYGMGILSFWILS